MKIKQISVFLENKVGVINELTSTLGRNGINMRAFSVAEGMEFGIMRLIVDDVDRAIEVLTEAHYTVSTADVLAVQLPNVAGALAALLDLLAHDGIFINYMYAFSDGDSAKTVIRTNDIERCEDAMHLAIATLSAQNELYKDL
ncbi:MAG: ACT domain-containing protein [Rikenellaceae bacterium]